MMERTQKQTKNLTEGSPARLILEFAVPMFLGLLFQQFYSMVDTMIVGKFLGMKPLAGVGATGSLNFMVIGFCIGVCNAGSTETWCQGLFCASSFCGECYMALSCIFCCYDGDRVNFVRRYLALYENTGGYFFLYILVYVDHFFRNTMHFSV